MARISAQTISTIFHPLLLPTYAFLLVIYANPFLSANINRYTLLLVIFLYTTVFPLITILLMIKLRFVKNLFMPDKQDRILPYIAVSFFFFYTFWVVHKKFAVPELIPDVLLGATLAAFIAFFINIFVKISMHAVGAGFFIVLAIVLSSIASYNFLAILTAIILLAGIVGSARLYLGAHHPVEVYAGYLVGMIALLVALQV